MSFKVDAVAWSPTCDINGVNTHEGLEKFFQEGIDLPIAIVIGMLKHYFGK
ncbi:MAG TPA: hypothetical protein VIJ75_06060 [Hanamia sp.]